MKTLILFIIACTFLTFSQQNKYYTYSELKGLEDANGNTHLFYRLHSKQTVDLETEISNSIYHLDLNNNSDTLFLTDNSLEREFLPDQFTKIYDLQFWDNDPLKYIYTGGAGGEEITPFVSGYEVANFDFPSFHPVNKIEISHQDNNLIYAFGEDWFKSTDKGNSWEAYLPGNQNKFVSLSPYDDKVFFAQNNVGLLKSTNSGVDFTVVNSDKLEHVVYYDKDSIHVYDVSLNTVYVSDNKGEAGSWAKKFETDCSCVLLSVDKAVAGTFYVSEKNRIYKTVDFGNTFTEFKVIPHKIIGLYKKSGSDKLYAATKYNLYEFTEESSTEIRVLPLNPIVFSYYPMNVGNKWMYQTSFSDGITTEYSIDSLQITGKKEIDGKEYFEFSSSFDTPYYLRIDSLEGKVYRHNDQSEPEFLQDDLLAEIGDTVHNRGGFHKFNEQDTITVFGLQTNYRLFEGHESNELENHTYYLASSIGVTEEIYNEEGEIRRKLFGAVINGITYGTLTDVAEDNNLLPGKFILSQNYPNPFNPSTTIRYSLAERVKTSLKVYDVLGNEIAALVNEEKPAGEYTVNFDGSNLSSGVYIYKIVAGNFVQSRKLLLIK